MLIYYRRKLTGAIEGKFIGCDTKSPKFLGPSFERFESEADLPLDLTPIPSPPPPWHDKLKKATTIKALREALMEAHGLGP